MPAPLAQGMLIQGLQVSLMAHDYRHGFEVCIIFCFRRDLPCCIWPQQPQEFNLRRQLRALDGTCLGSSYLHASQYGKERISMPDPAEASTLCSFRCFGSSVFILADQLGLLQRLCESLLMCWCPASCSDLLSVGSTSKVGIDCCTFPDERVEPCFRILFFSSLIHPEHVGLRQAEWPFMTRHFAFKSKIL